MTKLTQQKMYPMGVSVPVPGHVDVYEYCFRTSSLNPLRQSTADTPTVATNMTEPCHKKTCLLHMQEQRQAAR